MTYDSTFCHHTLEQTQKMGRSEAVISRWTTGFPNLTLKSIAELSTAIGEPLIQIPSSR